MDRTIPYFTERIVPDAIDQGKRVLISSSENAIRGLLMHLCEIPEEEITGLEIPNGLPLIFDVKSKCVKVRSFEVGVTESCSMVSPSNHRLSAIDSCWMMVPVGIH
jgi:bisphosphoglycerate-dependent phosphoglycerate mutase